MNDSRVNKTTHALLIEKITHNTPTPYYTLSDSRTNNAWIVQYDTTLSQMIHYAQGRIDLAHDMGFKYDLCFSDKLASELDQDLHLCLMTETEFKGI